MNIHDCRVVLVKLFSYNNNIPPNLLTVPIVDSNEKIMSFSAIRCRNVAFSTKSRMNGYKQILESFCIITNKMWTRSSTTLYEKRVACGKFITQFYGMHGDCKRDFAFTL